MRRLTLLEMSERVEKLIERKTPTVDVPYENAAALWRIARELQRIADVMEEAHK